MHPKNLFPNNSETIILKDQSITIPKCNTLFKKWNGTPVKESFGGKPIVCIDNKPMFAEIAILHLFIADGWDARWVETYGRAKKAPKFIAEWKDDKYKNQVDRPFSNNRILTMLDEIMQHNSNSYSGCWDVLGWKDEMLLFAEAKRSKKDKMRSTQSNWLEAALDYGLKPENFLIVEWEFE